MAFGWRAEDNSFEVTFGWRADDGPFSVAFGSSHPSSNKKSVVRVGVGTPLTILSGSAHEFAADEILFSPTLRN